jgi:hypothetical protein
LPERPWPAQQWTRGKAELASGIIGMIQIRVGGAHSKLRRRFLNFGY